jgi:hypothetical protein
MVCFGRLLRTVLWIFCLAGCPLAPSLQAASPETGDVAEIVRMAAATIESDWEAALDYAHIEKNEVLRNGVFTSRTSQVVMIAGSDYYLPLAINDEPLSPDRETAELQKLKAEFQRRNRESAETAKRRISGYNQAREEDGALLREFPRAFDYELLREETLHEHSAWVLAASPKPADRSLPATRAAKILAGMRGTLWVDRQTFHVIQAEGNVVRSVPIYSIFAKVLPGTHIETGMLPAADSFWFISELSMSLAVSKFFVFRSTEVTRSTYSGYRLNGPVVGELLAKAELCAGRPSSCMYSGK